MSENNQKRPQQQQRQGGPMAGFGVPVQKAKNFKTSFFRLVSYLKPHRLNLFIVLIFAILSTTFAVVAPKVTGWATNSLQDSYMAGKMLKEMGKGQNEAVDKLVDKMTDAQKKAVDGINDKMADGQKEAVDKISKNMEDAQVKAANSIYDNIALSLYKGVANGQKTAVSSIEKQMGNAQKSIVDNVKKQMQMAAQMQAAMQKAAVGKAANPVVTNGKSTLPTGKTNAQTTTPAQLAAMAKAQSATKIDPKTQEAIKKVMALPLINEINDTSKKLSTTLKFIDILKSMPTTGTSTKSMNPKDLATIQELLKLPVLTQVSSSEEKEKVVKQFMEISKKLPGSTKTGASSMKLDDEIMNKAYDRISELKSFDTSTSSSSTSTKIKDSDMDTVKELLNLPLIKDIKDPKKKTENLIKLMDVFSKLPNSTTGTKDSSTTISKNDIQTVKEIVSLPSIKSISDPKKKAATVVQMVDLFNKMPNMDSKDSKNTNNTIKKSDLANVKKLLEMPAISSIPDREKKLSTITEMLDIFASMPDAGNSKSGSSDVKMDKKSLSTLKEFLTLPKLDQLTDANQRADVSKKIIDLGKKLETSVNNAPKSPSSDVKFTDDQITSVIKAIRETNGKYDFGYIGIIALVLIGMYIISSLFNLVMGLVMSGVAQKTVFDLRKDVDLKLSKLPLKYFDVHPHGDILSRVSNDIDTISTTLQQSLTQVITSVITIIGYIIMMLSISPILTLIVIATLPLYVFATMTIAKQSQKYFGAQQKELGKLSGHVEEMYTGHKIVKAFGHEEEAIKHFEDINGKLEVAGWKAQFVSGILFPVMNFVSNLGYVGISIVGGLWITKSLLGLGDMLAFIQYSRSFTMPIIQTANIANVIQSTVACAERVFEILDEEEEIPDAVNAIEIANPQGEVEFKHVAFRYVEDVPLIEDMNMKVQKGHTIAIVGPTGAGKTTLVNLLMRFYELNSGEISIDGKNIKDLKRSELRKMFGMVLQDTWLFNGTIKDNIAYSRENATMEEIIRAAKAAHADHFIRTLPEGYNTILNEEATNISQGQKQLLTIARAILADPTILILDEATSSVDTRTEVLIQKAMANLMKDRTSFVIAHRLSTIRDAELILVMNKGSIIEMGNHVELLNKGGFYADLYNSQFSGANLDGEAV